MRSISPPRTPAVAVTGSIAGAYSATGGAWQAGPGRIYDRLAEVVVGLAPAPIGPRAVDVGAGTGAASRALIGAGATTVVAVDVALGMLTHDAGARPPAAVGDGRALPFGDGSFDVAVAAFSLNHVADPATGLRELARVTRPGGAVVASSYAAGETHPVKAAVEEALRARGWTLDPWFGRMLAEAVPRLATVDGCRAAAAEAGLAGAEVVARSVPFPDLAGADLVRWRLGMAQHAPFLADRTAAERDDIADDALARLGPSVEPLVRSILVITTVRRP